MTEPQQPSYEEVVARIERQINENPIVIYMKGSPRFPSCGFSAKAVQALINQNVDFAFVDILQNPDIRKVLPEYGDWPTFPQLWVEGELVGGCDIIMELEHTGELKTILEAAQARAEAAQEAADDATAPQA